MKKQLFVIFTMALLVGASSFAQSNKTTKGMRSVLVKNDSVSVAANHRITFVELGSVNCIPCKAMQPVMKSVEEKYGGQVKVVFYDVWKREQAHYAQDFGIRVIPTQVFLDKAGKEILRHEGFFPESQIESFLQSKGLKTKASVED